MLNFSNYILALECGNLWYLYKIVPSLETHGMYTIIECEELSELWNCSTTEIMSDL